MVKKIISTAIAAAMLGSMTVIPAHAATFSIANWVQYAGGFTTNTTNYFKQYYPNYDSSGNLIGAKMVATKSLDKNSPLPDEQNPVRYYCSNDRFGAGVGNAAYAHFRVNLATFSDEIRNAFDYFEMRSINSSGSEQAAFMFDVWKIDGTNYDGDVYAKAYSNANAYVTKDWGALDHQGKIGKGPSQGVTANSHQTALADSDYDKIDLIAEYNKQNGVTFYLFANGKFMGSWHDSTITTKHFNGVSFIVLNGRTIRNNSDYIAVKFDADRIGHREYYNTSGYTVTFEDVLQDAGLGGEIDSTMMYKTKAGDLQWYMPGNEQTAYHYPNKLIDGSTPSARVRIGENITYSGTEATIAVTNTGADYVMAARMLAGLLPINEDYGVAYESGNFRAKYIKLSFDQTISKESMWVEYRIYNSEESVQALQMWRSNEGNLVVGIRGGGGNVNCTGSGGKPAAAMTGTNHIDWILEPISNTKFKHYIFVNNKLAGEGNNLLFNSSAKMINNIILSTKNSAGNVTIDNWSMTVYNENADIAAIAASYKYNNIQWGDNYEIGYSIHDGKITVLTTATNNASVTPSANTKVITAIYDENDRLLDAVSNNYTSGSALSEKTVTNDFTYSNKIKTIKAFVVDYADGGITAQTPAFEMTI